MKEVEREPLAENVLKNALLIISPKGELITS